MQRTRLSGALVVAVLCIGLSAGGAKAVNLLTNGDFESGPLGALPSGWTAYGQAMDSKVRNSASFIYNPTPAVIEGSNSFSEGFNGAAGTGGIRQQVAVTPGSPYTFSGQWHVGDQGTSTWHEAGIFDGNVSDATITAGTGGLGAAVETNINGEKPVPGWAKFQVTVVPTQSTITVYTKVGSNKSSTRANWFDDLQLVAGTPLQHAVTAIAPRAINGNTSNTHATVTGTGLDADVTVVKLVQGGTELVGTNVTLAPPAYTTLTADFPTIGAPYGDYDLVVIKPTASTSQVTLTAAFRVRDPSANLLINGNFDAGPLNAVPTGWTTWGRGWSDNMSNNYAGDDLFIHCPKVSGVNTPFFGTYSYRCGEQNSNGGDAGIYQQVPVVPGETLVLNFQWGGGSDVIQSVHEVGIIYGAGTGGDSFAGNRLASATKGSFSASDPAAGQWGWESRTYTVVIPSNVSTATVFVRTWRFPGSFGNYATWADEIKLSGDPGCANQHNPSGVNPSSGDCNTAQDLTVSGTNMDQVTGIRLVNGTVEVPGSITSSSSGSLVAHFEPLAGGVPLGTYDVLTEQTGCLSRILSDVFTYVCNTPVTLTSVSPGSLQKPQGIVQLTVNGANVDKLDQIWLEYTPDPRTVARYEGYGPFTDPLNAGQNLPADSAPWWLLNTAEIRKVPGTVVDASNPSAVVVEFDLTNAQIGKFKLVGKRNNTCGSPADLLNAFEMQAPTGSNLLVNGNFDTGAITPWVLTPEPGGVTDKGDPMPGPEYVSAPGGGSEWYAHHTHSGDWMVGCKSYNDGNYTTWSTPNKGYLSQSIGLPAGPGHYDLTLMFWMRMFDQQPQSVGCSVKASIKIDGNVASSVEAQLINFPLMTVDGQDPYTLVSVGFSGDATQDISVEFYFKTSAGGFGATSSIVVDDVQLIGSTSCNSTWYADVDEDGDVDQVDFAVLQRCLGEAAPTGVCRCLDHDGVTGLDSQDFAAFATCKTGPNVPYTPGSNPNCAIGP